MATSRFDLAIPAISRTMDGLPGRVFRQRELHGVLEAHRTRWKLPPGMGVVKFIELLLATKRLTQVRLEFQHRPEVLYTWGRVSPLGIAQAVKPDAYLSHLSAMQLHGLTDSEPRDIFVNSEQSARPAPQGPLRQMAIDAAFRRKQRATQNHARLGRHMIHLVNGKQTNRLGVVKIAAPDSHPVSVTGLERTLIDIVVRPAYSGGPASVLEAFRRACGRVCVADLADMLVQMDYAYPYRQAIGFCLDRAGCYASGDVQRFKEPPFQHDFYLGYAMTRPAYSDKWRLYIPRELS